MQICFNLAFIFIYVTLIMAQDAPKRRFLSLIFLVLCISKSFLIDLFFFRIFNSFSVNSIFINSHRVVFLQRRSIYPEFANNKLIQRVSLKTLVFQ